ncbi:MAG: thioredoxin family protein [bacterium]
MVTVITDESFHQEVIKSPQPVLVQIGAEWCGTCHIMEPVLENLVLEYGDRIKFVRMDIETNEQIARDYGVNELPIFLFYKGGQIVDHLVGMVSRKKMTAKLEALMNK